MKTLRNTCRWTIDGVKQQEKEDNGMTSREKVAKTRRNLFEETKHDNKRDGKKAKYREIFFQPGESLKGNAA